MQEDVCIVSIQGSIDSATAPDLENHLMTNIEDGKTNIVINFMQVDFMSSAGLRVLLEVVKKIRETGGDLYLSAISPEVERILSISGFTSIMLVFADNSGAVDHFLALGGEKSD